jgi:hypothetical protein
MVAVELKTLVLHVVEKYYERPFKTDGELLEGGTQHLEVYGHDFAGRGEVLIESGLQRISYLVE